MCITDCKPTIVKKKLKNKKRNNLFLVWTFFSPGVLNWSERRSGFCMKLKTLWSFLHHKYISRVNESHQTGRSSFREKPRDTTRSQLLQWARASGVQCTRFPFPAMKVVPQAAITLGRGKPSLVCLVWSHLYLRVLFVCFGHTMQLVGFQFPHQISNPCPWQWKHKVLTTGPSGNCPILDFLIWE